MASTIEGEGTIIVLSGIGVAPYSMRQARQTLEPIPGAIKRTVNGGLANLSLPAFRKYASTISWSSPEPPSYDLIWPGKEITVECVCELGYLTGATGAPGKTGATGSSRTEGSFTFYRPVLNMMVLNYSMSFDEWACAYDCELRLEER